MPQPVPDAQLSSSSSSRDQPGGIRCHAFQGDCLDLPVHFQILDLGRQLYVWVGTGSPAQAASMDNLAVALPALPGTQPAASSLVRGQGDQLAADLARKLVQKLGKPVALSWSLPGAAPVQAAWAQRELMQHLQNLGYVQPSANGTHAAAQHSLLAGLSEAESSSV